MFILFKKKNKFNYTIIKNDFYLGGKTILPLAVLKQSARNNLTQNIQQSRMFPLLAKNDQKEK